MSYRQILIKSHKPKCIICLDTIQNIGDEVKLPCSCTFSIYHEQCILEYLENCDPPAKCPTCRKEMIPTNHTTTQQSQQSLPLKEEAVQAMIKEKTIHIEKRDEDYLIYRFPFQNIHIKVNDWVRNMQLKEEETNERSFLERIENQFISALNKK